MVNVVWRREFAAMYNGIDAQQVANEISEIGESATPAQILERATDNNSELHKCFEWDDTTAAYQYRLQQARTITHHLVVETSNEKSDLPPIRYLVKTTYQDGYKPIDKVIRRSDEYEQLLAHAISELRAFKQKYSLLSELKEIFDLIP